MPKGPVMSRWVGAAARGRRSGLLAIGLAFTVASAAIGCASGSMAPADGGRPPDAGRAIDGSRDASRDAQRADAGDAADAEIALDAGRCPAPLTRCGDECVDTSQIAHCGACGNDCRALPGVDPSRARCLSSRCQLSGACAAGFGDCNAMAADGCEAALDTAAHCGNCVVTCGGATPVCSATMPGAFACATGCAGATPDRCGDECTDVRGDPDHCGACDRVCTTSEPFSRPTCVMGICGVSCATGYHDCGGTCVSDADPMSCGTSCTPCPAPMLGMATCTAGSCGVACMPGATMCAGDCVDVATSRAHCGGCMRPCSGACVGGVCDTGVRITLGSGGDQMGFPNQVLASPIVMIVYDASMAPISGAAVTFTAPPGAVVTPASTVTDSMGRAAVVVRLGRAVGSHRFEASTPMGLAPATADATAIAPPLGTLYPIANAAHTSSAIGTPGPAPAAGMGAVRGIAVDADGTLYVADSTYQVVRAITPAGHMTIVAGRVSSAGFTGDGADATMAQLRTPSGLALDRARRRLYVADTGNQRVRMVDLMTGIITTVAGGGTAAAPAYGDGGTATGAVLSNPGHVRIGPDGALYIADTGHHRIRRVDPVTGFIDAYVSGGSTTCAVPVSLYGCQSELRTCDIAWGAGGRAFVSGYVCGTQVGTSTWGILRRETDGTLVHVGGLASGLTADGSPISGALFSGAGSMATDPAGNVYVIEQTSHRIRRIDATTATYATLMGTGAAGYGSDHVISTGQPLNVPWDLAFDDARTLYVSESTNYDVRAIWQAGSSARSVARLEVAGGGTQSIEVSRQTSMAFAARLVDGIGSPLVGIPVRFAAIDPGGGVVASSAPTTIMGIAATFGRPGLAVGAYRFEARYDDLHGTPVMGSPAMFTVTATAPAAGAIFTAVNVARTAGAVTGPATYGRTGQLSGLAIASDGTIYVADRTQHAIWRVTPRGELTVLAGSPPTAGFTGDGGPATMARLSGPTGVALDEASGFLYIADRINDRVRAVDLASGVIRTVAGGGVTTLPAPYGDGGAATAALLADPGSVSVGPTGLVYIADTGHNRIRVLDPALGIIDAWLGTTTGCTTTPLVFYGCGSNPTSCHVIFDASGVAWISGQLCGNVAPLSTTAAFGIVRRDTDGTLTHVAGMRVGMTTEGIDARTALITGAGWLARDAMGALHYADYGAHRIRRIDPMAGTVTTLAGTGAAGFAGEYVPALSAQLSTPWGIAFANGHLFIADNGNNALRVIW